MSTLNMSTSTMMSTVDAVNETVTTLSTSTMMSTVDAVNETVTTLSTSILNVTSSLSNATLSNSVTSVWLNMSTESTDDTTDSSFLPDMTTSYSDYGNVFMYPGYSFERPIYLYIWEFLVLFTTIVNILVIVVLLRRGMRNPTNMILAAIAISDSMTGLVTLPTYIMVYERFEPAPTMAEMQEMDRVTSSLLDPTTVSFENQTEYTYYSQEGYVLTEDLCRAFMISKFFLSKFFHTISIFLTLFLGFQRFISVAYPFKAQSLFTMSNTVVVCAIIFLLSPILHVYHLQNEKALDGMCEWRLENCKGDCAFLWIILIVRHIIPCTLLSVFTILFIKELRKCRLEMNQEQTRRRAEENRRVSIIVTAIVVVFLVPEIPYGVFLLSSVIRKHAKISFDLESNRAIHAIYEISLVLSFHANFYIYTFLNKRFRAGLKRTFLYPVRKAMGKPARWTLSRSFSSRSGGNRKTMESDFTSKTATEMRLVRLNTSDNSRSTMETNCKVDTKMINDSSVSDSK